MKNPVKKFMDKLQKPSTHKSKKSILSSMFNDIETELEVAHIIVAEDFSLSPSGITLQDGPDSFEAFELYFGSEFLAYSKIIVDFTGVLTVGSQFINSLAKFVLKNNLEHKVEIVSDLSEVSSKYKKYLLTN